MTPEGLAAKAELDKQLTDTHGDISIALGSALYIEMGKAGLITLEDCRAVGFNHLIQWPMYGYGRFANCWWDLNPYQFIVGDAKVQV